MKRAKKMFVPRNGLKPVCFDQILIKLWKLVKNNYIELLTLQAKVRFIKDIHSIYPKKT